MRHHPISSIPSIATACLLLALPGLSTAHPAQASAAMPKVSKASKAGATQQTPLEVGRTQEIQLDEKALFGLKPGQKAQLDLGGAGTLPLVFEHATARRNDITFWEAHVAGDPRQRVSIKRDARGLTGSVMLQNRRYWISQTAGKTFLTRMSDAYVPAQTNVSDQKVFGAPILGEALAKVHAERPDDLPETGAYPVAFDMKPLRQLPLNSEVELNLPDGRTVSVVHDNSTVSPSGNYTFIGYVRDQGTGHRVVITTGAQGETFGVINLPEGEVRVETRKGQTWLVDTEKAGIVYAPLAEPLIPQEAALAAKAGMDTGPAAQAVPSLINGAVTAAAPGDSIVDLMVVYTPGMVSRLGGDAQARTRIDNLVAVTNQIMVDSQVQIQMRLVKTLYVNQTDNVNQGNLLTAITNGQGAFSGVKAARDAAGADLVHLLHKPTAGVGSCGIAYLSVSQGPRGNANVGYGVTDDSCRTYVMAHELGHNFGMNHDHANSSGTPVYPYAWGYIVPGTNTGDVMSYAGQRIYKFSNPRIGGCANQPCGQENYADASRAMNQTRTIVAGYRPTVTGGGGTTTPPNGRYRISATHSNLCMGVNGASLDDGALLSQGNCSGINAPFDLSAVGNGLYKLVNVNSGKALGVANASTADGARIWQWVDGGTSTQRFSLKPSVNGGFTIVNQASGKCVDVSGASTADGAAIIQWPCHGRANQSFRFAP